jgi:uncharacterized repeat protein (TIGR03803 family)
MLGLRVRLSTLGPVLAALMLASGCSHASVPSPLPNALSPVAIQPDSRGFKVLYTFGVIPDAMNPAAGLIAVGNKLYGTTQAGGMGGGGSVFSTGLTGGEHVLHSFSFMQDGSFPVAALTYLSGTFYGTTSAGGTGFGTVFKLSKSGKERVIYAFAGGADGAAPYTPLVADGGVLYGATTIGGGNTTACAQGCGTVFSITASGKEHVLYRFKGGSRDGFSPYGSLVVVNGELYGTTADGGTNGEGTIFKTSKRGAESVIYSFGSVANDGSEPESGLVNVGGKLYGTTNTGGSNFKGSVYVTTVGGAERVIYSFKGGHDGENPEANLIYYKGRFYGTTAAGGASNQGTIFAVTPGGAERVIRALKGSDGSDPRAPLTLVKGKLYGTTSLGGKNSTGTIFKVSP